MSLHLLHVGNLHYSVKVHFQLTFFFPFFFCWLCQKCLHVGLQTIYYEVVLIRVINYLYRKIAVVMKNQPLLYICPPNQQTCTHVYTHSHIPTTCTYMHTSTNSRTCTHIYKLTCVHTCTHTHNWIGSVSFCKLHRSLMKRICDVW